MTNVKLKAALPKDAEFNGLGEKAVADFLADLRRPRVAIVVLQAEEVTRSLANGTEVPKVVITRIELVEDTEEERDLIRRAQALSEVRTGNTPLPTVGGAVDDSALDFDDDEVPA